MRPLRSERYGTHHNGGLTAGADIKLRGIGSFNGASRPLILVDNGQRSAALNSPSKSAIESYLCTDGRPIGLSPLYRGDATLSNVMANRDKRLFITVNSAHLRYTGHAYNVFASGTGYRPIKFLPDSNTLKMIPTGIGTNLTDAPLFWLAEVYLNYVEAAAELEDMGKYTLTQADLDNTVNKLRARGGVAPLTSIRLNANGYIMPYPATSQRMLTDPNNYLSAIPTNHILLYPASIQASMQNPGW
jgi:hypothetical protein